MKFKLILFLFFFISAITMWLLGIRASSPIIVIYALIKAHVLGFAGLTFLGLYLKDKLNEKKA